MVMNKIAYAYIAAEESYPDGEVVIQEGAKNDCVYVVLEGTVKIKKSISKGQVTLATLKQKLERMALRGIQFVHVSSLVSNQLSQNGME